MAEAVLTTRDREVTLTVTEEVVELTLTVEEARTLRDITGVIGGAPGNNSNKPDDWSRRAWVDNIAHALSYAGIQYTNNTCVRSDDLEGSLHFDSVPRPEGE